MKYIKTAQKIQKKKPSSGRSSAHRGEMIADALTSHAQAQAHAQENNKIPNSANASQKRLSTLNASKTQLNDVLKYLGNFNPTIFG